MVSATSPSRGLPPVQRLGSANLDRNIPSPNGRRDPSTPARVVRSTRTPPTGNHMLMLDADTSPTYLPSVQQPRSPPTSVAPVQAVEASIPTEMGAEDSVTVTPIPSLYAPGTTAVGAGSMLRRGDSDAYDEDSDFDSDDDDTFRSPPAPPPLAAADQQEPAFGGESPVATSLPTTAAATTPPLPAPTEVRRSISKRPPLYLRVEKRERIGRGSFGDVYRAVDPENGQEVAIKEIVVAQDCARDLEKQMHILEREVRVMQKLDHPNTVKYLGAKRINDSLNIYMEYVNGGTIASLLRHNGVLEEDVARRYTHQLLLGLEYLHDKRIAHRDLKGDNLFLTKSDTLKVGDFGTSKELQTLRVTDSVAGTPNFMAPEVIACSGHSFQADIWSVGCCVIQMISGKPPFSTFDNHMAVMFAVMKGQIEAQIPKNISPSLADFLRKCVCMEPKDRWTTKQLLLHPWIVNDPSPLHNAPETPPALTVPTPKPEPQPTPLPPTEQRQPTPPAGERQPTPPATAKPKSASRPTSTEAKVHPRPVIHNVVARGPGGKRSADSNRTSPPPNTNRKSPPPSAEQKGRSPFVARFPRKANSEGPVAK